MNRGSDAVMWEWKESYNLGCCAQIYFRGYKLH